MRKARICIARSDKVSSNHCYLDGRPLHEIDGIVMSMTENNFIDWYTLHYQEEF